MKILIIGAGSIGEKHIHNLLEMKEDVTVFDVDTERIHLLQKRLQIKILNDLSHSSLQEYEIIFICTPTHTHVPLAKSALEAGAHLFIEKPISALVDQELLELEKMGKNYPAITLIGCNMRFHEGVRELKKVVDQNELGKIYGFQAFYGHYLPNWRTVDYRKTYSAKKEEGGGILLESIHEFDYLTWMFGEIKTINTTLAKVGALEIETEDMALVTLTFKSGIAGTINLDYLQKTKRRGCEIIGEKGTIRWESYGKNPETATVTFFQCNEDKPRIKIISIDPNDPYLEEVRYFLKRVRDRQKTDNPVERGVKTLKIIEAAKQSAELGRCINL